MNCIKWKTYLFKNKYFNLMCSSTLIFPLVLSFRTIKVEVYDWDRDGRLGTNTFAHITIIICQVQKWLTVLHAMDQTHSFVHFFWLFYGSLDSDLCIFFTFSHDFIGEFTTSYRELARGQSQFNVYEVSSFTNASNHLIIKMNSTLS